MNVQIALLTRPPSVLLRLTFSHVASDTVVHSVAPMLIPHTVVAFWVNVADCFNLPRMHFLPLMHFFPLTNQMPPAVVILLDWTHCRWNAPQHPTMLK